MYGHEKALEIARKLHMDEDAFKASNGFLASFRERHKTVGDMDEFDNWTNETIPCLLKDYNANHIYNINQRGNENLL